MNNIRFTNPLPARFCMLAVVLLPLLGGCSDRWPGKPSPADRPLAENQRVQFEFLYQHNCAGCHGAEGRLGPAPPLNDALFWAIVPDDVLLEVVRQGRQGTPMPAFASDQGGSLTDPQVAALAAGIKRHWQPQTAKPGSGAADLATNKLPPYRLTQVETGSTPLDGRTRGAEIFAGACAGCHGENGGGGKNHEDSLHDPDFLALISDQALRRIIITGRPDLGMPSYSGSDGRGENFQPLTSAQIDDLVALLASWRSEAQATVPREQH